MRTKPLRAVLAAFALVGALAVAPVPAAAPAHAAGARPLFQLPFPCGQTWRLATYYGHDDYDIDMTWTGGGSNDKPILASYSGTVSFSGWGSGGGWYVVINHGNGWTTEYLHMIRQPMVAKGQWVVTGQQIGNVGSTGNSTGPHLHYVQYADGVRTESYFNGVPSGITSDGSPNTGPLYISGPVSSARNVTSANCGVQRRETVSDFSGDGHADVLGVNSAGELYYYPNNGNALSSAVQLGHGWGTFKHVMADDWSGDGHADVLGVDSAGDLWYYPNNGLALSARVQLGHGWGTFRHVMAADWSGDGYADVLGVDAAGDLWYYPHSGAGFGTRVQIGNGWGAFKHVMAADWSGDGHADVLGVDSAGDLWYYPHSGAGFGTRVQLGHGWGTFKHVIASDFSGDGYADVLGVDASGYLWYYPHSGSGFGTRVQLGHGWGAFPFVM